MATVRSSVVAASILSSLAVAGCSFTYSSGGLDYEKLEGSIAAELTALYDDIGVEATAVECPRRDELAAGDSFECTADVDDQSVRVEVNVTDDDYGVDVSTLDVLFDMGMTAARLEQEISADQGFLVTVDCGDGLKAVAIGESFECTAVEAQGDSVGVEVTAGAPGEGDSWQLVE